MDLLRIFCSFRFLTASLCKSFEKCTLAVEALLQFLILCNATNKETAVSNIQFNDLYIDKAL
jgi:hypothetical protein